MYKYCEFDVIRRKLALAIEAQLRSNVEISGPVQTSPFPPDLKMAALLSIGKS